jgi:hypothetical protein
MKLPPSPPLTPAGFFPMKLLLILAAIYAALVAVNHLNPGPGEADVRGPATRTQRVMRPEPLKSHENGIGK